MPRPFPPPLLAALLAIALAASPAGRLAAAPPNLVLILADDLGAHDLACTGGDLVRTPALDRLAAEGLTFRRALAPAPVCTPSRAALLTGLAPARLGITIWSEGAREPGDDHPLREAPSLADLPLGAVTLAERLAEAGYLTASVGKWHLGDADHAPETQGFEVNIGGTHWGAPVSHFFPWRGVRKGGEVRYVPHLEFGREGEHLTDRLTTEAIRVVDHAADAGRPFFLLLSSHAPHTPIEASPERIAAVEARMRPGQRHRNAAYVAMVEQLDENVGRLVERLDRLDRSRDTVVIFTSDNGGYLGTDARGEQVTDNFPLRSGKGTLYEGGLRVPLLVRCPGRVPQGATCDEPVILTDLFPTLLSLAGLGVDTSPCDGVDLAPLLADPAVALPRDALFFHYPHHYHAPPTGPASALRTARHKLVEHYAAGTDGALARRLELFDLESDPAEARDIAAERPALAAELAGRLHRWLEDTGAKLPAVAR